MSFNILAFLLGWASFAIAYVALVRKGALRDRWRQSIRKAVLELDAAAARDAKEAAHEEFFWTLLMFAAWVVGLLFAVATVSSS